MIQKQKFNLHISVSHNNIDYIASCIFGNNSILMSEKAGNIHKAISTLISELSSYTTFDLLLQNPLMSMWPVPVQAQQTSISQQLAQYGALTSMFDLHIECGYEVNQNNLRIGTYAYTQIDNGQCHKFKGTGGIFEDSIENLVVDLTIHKMFDQLTSDPSFSVFPFVSFPHSGYPSGSPSSSPPAHRSTDDVARPAEVAKKDLPRNLPSALIGESHPQCQDTCTSWDIFGESKCKNMCEWRKEV
jgi:hypothetical protein